MTPLVGGYNGQPSSSYQAEEQLQFHQRVNDSDGLTGNVVRVGYRPSKESFASINKDMDDDQFQFQHDSG